MAYPTNNRHMRALCVHVCVCEYVRWYFCLGFVLPLPVYTHTHSQRTYVHAIIAYARTHTLDNYNIMQLYILYSV